MDYKEELKNLIDSIENPGLLEYLYKTVSGLIAYFQALNR